MFIFTTKLTKGKALALVGGLFILICIIILLVSAIRSAVSGPSAASGLFGSSNETETAKTSYKNIKTNDDRIAFLVSFGWEVSAEPVEIEEVVIPKEFDSVYAEYNEIQKYQSLDLMNYKGKKVKRYTYEILNYPTGEKGVHANILIYDDRIIGGDICSSSFEGFMHGFEKIDY